MKASFIGNIFGPWGTTSAFNPDFNPLPVNATSSCTENTPCSEGWCHSSRGVCIPWGRYALGDLERTITAINAAYDCEGLRRPIIQASIFESITRDTPAGQMPDSTKDGIHQITISPIVIDEFRDEIFSLNEQTRYFRLNADGTYTAKTDVKFDFLRIAYPCSTGSDGSISYSPDAFQLEGRMWLFHEAKCLVDVGITAIHMGQTGIWAKIRMATNEAARTLALQQAASVVTHIRNYANNPQKTVIGPTGMVTYAYNSTATNASTPFVLLASEASSINRGKDQNGNYTEPFGMVKMAYGTVNGYPKLLFDFMASVLRPRDIIPEGEADPCTGITCPTVGGVGCLEQRSTADPRCTVMSEPIIPPSTEITPSGELPMTIVDPCHGGGLLPDGAGISPIGKVYTVQTPYLAGLDGWEGEFGQRCDAEYTGPAERGCRNPLYLRGSNFPYADDGTWFMNLALIPDASLKALAIQYQAQWSKYYVRAIRKFSINASATFMHPAGMLGAFDDRNKPHWCLTDDPAKQVQNAIREAWEPADTLKVSAIATTCGEVVVALPWRSCSPHVIKAPKWLFMIANPCAGSIYTWHRRRPDGSYEELAYGPTLEYIPNQQGQYDIAVQEDNLALPTASGNRFYSMPPNSSYSDFTCCNTSPPATATNLKLLPFSEDEFHAKMAATTLVASTATDQVKGIEPFPKPTSDELSIRVLAVKAGRLKLQISNVLGQEVPLPLTTKFVSEGPGITIPDTSILPQGVYILRVKFNDMYQTKLFTKL
ncbi:T9SS type A sorting domain-containing protein [Hymenobacter negativus]|uniref:T9SS type A sorting domain-containing protein n=1 Tax=Hymenobacter negativus TaxID=2795026 RepID=A0ABS3QJF8_9BACT|nr:T9SS type A sorting domain-containing protein [Hymenobacter negativus]MBO2010914.1 T9SS type A sorting domain-containing protein [Hymenobacter negativus]